MGDKQILLGLVVRARDALKKAQTDADNTPRPQDACPAHDSQFALTKALSGALDTLLLVKEEELRDSPRQQDARQDPWYVRVLLIVAKNPLSYVALIAFAFSPHATEIVKMFTNK